MGIFDDMSALFGGIEKRELDSREKVQYVEDLVRECARDLAFSRDEVYREALAKKTTIMVRQSETHIKKFESNGDMYISLPETIYEDIADKSDFDQYHDIMDLMKLTLAAPEYREKDEDGNLNFIEAEVVDNASKNYEEKTGLPLSVEHIIERDEFGQAEKMVDEKQMFEPKKYTAVKPDGEEEKDDDDKAADSCSSTPGDGESESESSVSMVEINDEVQQEQKEMKEQQVNQDFQSQYTSQSITDIEQKQVDELKDSTFYYGRYGNEDGCILSKADIAGLNKQVKSIAKSLKGYDGKVKRLNPSKRLSSKDICNDISDKIYIGKSYTNGKYIDQNIVVDCSGSMGGQPISDAIKLCYVFNKLAQEELLEGSIILTESSENRTIKMPVHDQIILTLGGTGGGEGAYKTLSKHMSILRNKNLIFVTDGDLVEEPIPDKYWESNKINCIGVYVNESVKAEDLPGYDKTMKRWFLKSIIRNSFDEMVQKLIQIGLRASTKG